MTDLPVEPAVDETTYDALPESVVSSVLDRWGYQQQTTEEPAASEQSESEPAATEPVEAGEEDTPAPPGGPIFDEPAADEEADDADQTAPDTSTSPTSPDTPPPTPTDPLTALLTERLADEQFRNSLLQLLLGPAPSQAPGVGAAPPTPPLAPTPDFPTITEDDLENPAVRASLLILNQQREQISNLEKQFADTQRQATERNAADLARVAESAVHAFQTAHNLPDDLTQKIRAAAGPMTFAASQATNSQDPFTVMDKALELAYWTVPEARKFEFERQSDARTRAMSRRQKLGGVGGNSGSASRTPPPPDLDTSEGRFDAAVAEVTAAMFGTDTQ